jgi:hypothetical protein
VRAAVLDRLIFCDFPPGPAILMGASTIVEALVHADMESGDPPPDGRNTYCCEGMELGSQLSEQPNSTRILPPC